MKTQIIWMLIQRVNEVPTLSLETWRRQFLTQIQSADCAAETEHEVEFHMSIIYLGFSVWLNRKDSYGEEHKQLIVLLINEMLRYFQKERYTRQRIESSKIKPKELLIIQ